MQRIRQVFLPIYAKITTKITNGNFAFRTHWKTTSCRPNTIEEELAIAQMAGSPTGGYYDYVGSDVSMGMCPSLWPVHSIAPTTRSCSDGCVLHAGSNDKEPQDNDSSDSFDISIQPPLHIHTGVPQETRPSVIETSQGHVIECT